VVPAPAAPGPYVAPATSPATPPRQKNRTGAVIAVGLAFGLLLALIVVLLMQVDLGGGGGGGPTLDVPNAVGVPYGVAEAALTKQGFKVVRVDDETQSSTPPDQVIAQAPEAGTKLRKGGTVTLTASSATLTMPDVVNQTREQAQAKLKGSGFTANFVQVDSTSPPGTVVSTDPGAGTKVPKSAAGQPGPTVTVNVAREPTVAVPDVANQDVFTANTALTAAGLVGQAVPTPSPTVAKGLVIGTAPAAGQQVPKGTTIQVQVSTGPELIDVPNVVGQTQAAAEAALLGAGLGVQEQFVNGGPAKKGLVISQNPAGGQVPKGSTVAIVIGL
jgi:serine/threonine-protein kinase